MIQCENFFRKKNWYLFKERDLTLFEHFRSSFIHFLSADSQLFRSWTKRKAATVKNRHKIILRNNYDSIRGVKLVFDNTPLRSFKKRNSENSCTILKLAQLANSTTETRTLTLKRICVSATKTTRTFAGAFLRFTSHRFNTFECHNSSRFVLRTCETPSISTEQECTSQLEIYCVFLHLYNQIVASVRMPTDQADRTMYEAGCVGMKVVHCWLFAIRIT